MFSGNNRDSSRKSRFCRLPQSTPIAAEVCEPRRLLSAITTYHNDLVSSGVNSAETLLTPTSVNVGTFGKQFSTTVDGQVYAQPLYVSALNISAGSQSGVHNTVFVATEHDSLYAIDSSGGNILWQTSFIDVSNPKVNLLGATSISTMPASETGSTDITVEIGITATPVIDAANGVIYVEAKSKDIVNGDLSAPHYVHTLYKVDIASGNILSSTIIGDTIVSGGGYTYRTSDTGTGTDPYVIGTGDGSININGENRVYFNAIREMDRPGLTLWQGHVILAFASHGDNGPYHGWVLMYDANTLGIQGAFNTTPNGGLGGIWQAGGGITFDSQGFMYFETGNGTFDSNNGVATVNGGFQGRADYGDSFLKIGLDPSSTQSNQNGNTNGWGLKLFDYFSPFNNQSLDSADTDLGSGGPTILPDSAGNAAHPHLLVGSGKEGKLYLIDRDNMGKFDPATDHVVQTVGGGINGSLNTPAFFNGRLYYFPGYAGPGRSFQLSNATIGSYQQTPDTIGYLDGTPSISANGVQNGVVWVIDRGSNQLKAYNAADLTQELWTSGQAANNRDQLGSVVKFAVPTVADGQVFVGTANQLVVYGPPVPVTSPPTAPSTLNLTAIAFNRVDLTWTDLSSNEDSFLIERSTDQLNWTQIGTAGANQTTYSDFTTQATTAYYYRVRAHNTFNTDSYSAYITNGPIVTPTAPPLGTGDGLSAMYYVGISTNAHLDGTPLLTRTDPIIDFDWGTGSPDPAVPVDHFSVRWTGTILPTTTQAYTFSTTSDDGVRLWVNNQLIIDNWTDHGPTVDNGTITLTGGVSYTVKMEFYENGGGAVARLHWSSPTFFDQPVTFQGAGATGMYFSDSAGEHLSGTPVVSRVDSVVDSNVIWDGTGAPSPLLGNTNFSAKWTGKIQPQFSQTYTFHTTSDDGVRLWVNGQLVIDDWTYHAPVEDYGTITLSAGQLYDIEMDFFQGGGGDVAQLRWSSFSTPDQIVPQSQLYSGVAPAQPTNLKVVAASGTELDLTWNDNSNIETGYSVERSTDGLTYSPIIPSLPAGATSYMDTALNPNVHYWYRVQALNFAANSNYSNVVDLTTPVPPNKPTNAHPTTVTATSIAMAWNDTANNEDGYRISRSANQGTFVVIATLPANTTTYVNTNLTPNTLYEYHIQAFNIAGYNDFTGFSTTTLSPLPATKLVFQQAPPSTANAGQASDVIIALEDKNGNVVGSENSMVTLTLSTGVFSTGTNTVTVAAIHGFATFSGLRINTVGTYTLTATDGVLTKAVSGRVAISPAPLNTLAFSAGPLTVTAGIGLSTVKVQLTDLFGNLITTATPVTLTLSGGTFSTGSTTGIVNSVGGVATFTGLRINLAGSYSLSASVGGVSTPSSLDLTIVPAAATKLVFLPGPPATGTAGVAFTNDVVVAVEDNFGNVVTTNTSDVTLTLNSGVFSNGTNTITVTAVNGLAMFSGIVINTSGNRTLIASATVGATVLRKAVSGNIAISPNALNNLAFSPGPLTVTAGIGLSTVRVTLTDLFGNLITAATPVTLTLSSGIFSSGSATGIVNSVGGVATFTGLRINLAGSYSLSASVGGMSTPSSLDLTVVPAAAAKLVYLPGTPVTGMAGVAFTSDVVVAVEDNFGNVVTTNTSDVTLTLNAGVFSNGTNTMTVTAVNGLATFSGIVINTSGNRTLTASATVGATVLRKAVSGYIAISPNSLNSMAFSAGPLTVTAGTGLSTVKVTLTDLFGNLITTATPVTLTLSSGTFSSGSTTGIVNSIGGIATFTWLKINLAGSYSLSATVGGISTPSSLDLTVVPAAAAKLVYLPGTPVTGMAGVAFTSDVVVAVEDNFGNVVTTNTSDVTLTLNAGVFSNGTNTMTVTAVNGLATFSGIVINTSGNRTLTASATVGATVLRKAVSGYIAISPNSLNSMAFSAGPLTVTAGTGLSTVKVTLTDLFGNLITTATPVTLTLNSGMFSSGSTTGIVNSVGGVATFTGLRINLAGSYSLSASAGGVSTPSSLDLTVVPAAAGKLVYLPGPPATGIAGVAFTNDVVVAVEDNLGNIVTTNTSDVTLALNSGLFSNGTNTITIMAINGLATFSNIVINTSGNHTLTATATIGTSVLRKAVTGNIAISPNALNSLAFTVNSLTVNKGTGLSTVKVTLTDLFGNLITAATPVTLTLSSGTFSNGSPTGIVNSVGGVATFAGLRINLAGNYSLSASAGGVSTSSSLALTVV